MSGMRRLCLLSVVGVCAAASECAAGGAGCIADDHSDVAEAALLQAKVQKVQAMGAERRGDASWAMGPNIVQMDPPATVPVPRHQVDSGYVRQLLIKFPMDTNPIKVVGNIAQIDMAKFMEGRFSRDSETQAAKEDVKDYGIEKAVAFVGASSAISDKVKLAFAEKSHSLWLPSGVRNSSKIKAEKDLASQSHAQKEQAKKDRNERNNALSQLALVTGSQIIVAGKDSHHLDLLRNYTALNRHLATSDWQEYKNANAELKRRREDEKLEDIPIRSTIGCLHFEDAELMKFGEDGIVEVPLDTQIVAWRGQLGFFPQKVYSMSSGIAVFHHNTEDDTFDIYFRFSSTVNMRDGDAGYQAEYYQGAVDGQRSRRSPDWRMPSISSPYATGLWDKAKSIPRDYTFMHAPRSQVGCDDDVLDSMVDKVDAIQKAMVSGGLMSMFSNMKNTMSTLGDEVNCAVEYLRPHRDDQVVAFGRLEAVGLLHVLMEMPGEIMVSAFKNDAEWNKYSLH